MKIEKHSRPVFHILIADSQGICDTIIWYIIPHKQRNVTAKKM